MNHVNHKGGSSNFEGGLLCKFFFGTKQGVCVYTKLKALGPFI